MARTLRYLFVLLLIGVTGTALAQSGEISGKVVDEKKEPIIGAIVSVTSGGITRGGAATDVDGNYVISPLATGSNFEVKVEYIGYITKIYKDVVVREGSSTKVNFNLAQNVKQLKEAVVVSYKVPLIEIGHPHGVLDNTDIKHTGLTSTADLVAVASPGIHVARSGGDLNAFGGRGNATQFIVDGVVVNGANTDLPQGMIDQVDVLSSGLPARYGDATGAVVNVTTRGPSRDFMGGLRLEHSVDGYNHNMASVNISGPLYSRKDSMGNKKPILGFLFGAEGWYDKDRNPFYGGGWVVNDDARAAVEQNPLTRSLNQNGTIVYKNSSEYITKADMHKEKVRPNSAVYEGRANGKLDFQVADNLNLTAGGSFNYSKGSALAGNSNPASQNGGASNGYRNWIPFAQDAIPQNTSTVGRGYLRFTQRFGKSGGTEKQSAIQNAYYSIQADYQVQHYEQQDPNFKKNIFEYAYVGKFDRQYAPGYIYSYDDSTKHYMYRLAGYRFPQQVLFERSDKNPLLANYTSEYYNLNGSTPADIVDIRTNGAMMNGDMPSYVYGTFANTGTSLSTYSYSNTTQFAVSADASFDLLLNKTRHSIQFGLYYQQISARSYSASANPSQSGQSSLWEVMRSLQNKHITDLDLENPMYRVNGNVYTWDQVKTGQIIPGIYDTVFYNRKVNLASQSTFDRHLREKLGLDPNGVDYLNVDGLDPSMYSLDMFSADELLNSGHSMVGYTGYDYTGKKESGNINFNDYFKEKDANGNYTRRIAANRPSYTAAYLQDHFRYKDIDFNIGVRVDRYDANTKVLKDPYSLYEENTVSDVKNNTTKGGNNTVAKTPTGNIPANMGDNYIVYVDNNSSQRPNIIGFRNGDEWYDAQGNILQDPSVLSVASGGLPPQPFLKDPNTKINDSAGFDASTSFTDYKPQVNVAPRISFSFPISTVANFYAHYDVVVQRPRGGRNYATPNDYYYLPQQASSIIDNNDLKPEKMFDYEVGFQQVLTKQSSVTISAFYRERKDMIQVRPYLYAWPTTYYTYGNRDFSTSKGMTISYDLRRFGNIRMKVNYTLSFAEGTGSGDASGNGGNANTVGSNGMIQNFILAGVPNLRNVSDLDYDSRHLITANVDYRYDEGTGPVVAGNHILQNAGVNFNLSARSGEPYTRRLDANPSNRTVQGQINGSRLPWHYMVDMRIDKEFSLRFKKQPAGEPDLKKKRPLSINGFVYFQNLLNIKDVITVYGYTGRPDDDGYLTSAQGIVAASTQTDAQAYRDVYSIDKDNPYNYNLPRRITIGLSLNF